MALYISVSQKIRRYLLWLTKFPTLASAAALAQQNVPFQQSLRVTVSTLSTLMPVSIVVLVRLLAQLALSARLNYKIMHNAPSGNRKGHLL